MSISLVAQQELLAPLQTLLQVLGLTGKLYFPEDYNAERAHSIIRRIAFEYTTGTRLGPLDIACLAEILFATAKKNESEWGLDVIDLIPSSELTGLGAIYFHMNSTQGEIAIANKAAYESLQEQYPELFTCMMFSIQATNEAEFSMLPVIEVGMHEFLNNLNSYYRLSEVATLLAMNLHVYQDEKTPDQDEEVPA